MNISRENHDILDVSKGRTEIRNYRVVSDAYITYLRYKVVKLKIKECLLK